MGSRIHVLRLRSALAVWVAAGLLAFGLVLAHGASPAGAVGACGWSVEHTATASQSFWANFPGEYTYLDVTLVTWTDGCGSKQYESLSSIRDHAVSGTYTTYLRVWTCGTLREQGSSAGTVRWSAVYNYGNCGRQADNGPSGSKVTGSFVPSTVTKYTNQG